MDGRAQIDRFLANERPAEAFGERLRQAREQRDLSVDEFADWVGISPRWLLALEQGFGRPDVLLLQTLENRGIGVEALIAGDLPERVAA